MMQEAAAENGIQPKMKRNVKDSVFTDLFGIPKYLIELYRALHPEDKKAEEKDIVNVTIKNILTDQPYNDYCIENSLDLYGSAKVKLPKPELYVIFTGDRNDHPDSISLKEEFFDGQDVAVDAKVKIIYDGQPGDIINQYVKFTKVANDQMRKYGRNRKAVEETIRICVDENVLTEYLKEREVEVMDIMTALFDEEEVLRRHFLSVERETRREESEKIARNMLNDGVSYEKISSYTGLAISDIEELAGLALA